MFSVNYRDPLPLYEQIKQKLQQMMLSGTISPETKLPSVRELATQLAINPNTIQRAYRELEAEGFIVSMPGKGSYPVETEILKTKAIARLYSEFDEAASKLTDLGVAKEALIARLQHAEGGEEK